MEIFKMTLTYEDGTLSVDYNDGSKTESYDIQDAGKVAEKAKRLIQEEIDEYQNIEKYMATAESDFYSCSACGKAIHAGDKFTVCSDCGGVFCHTCAHDGTFESHECEPDDLEGD